MAGEVDARSLRELRIQFNGHETPGRADELCQHGRVVAGSGAEVHSAVAESELECFDCGASAEG